MAHKYIDKCSYIFAKNLHKFNMNVIFSNKRDVDGCKRDGPIIREFYL